MSQKAQHIAQLIAQEEIDQFLDKAFLNEKLRLAYRHFAQHAAFPVVLTTDLLYNIWLNFSDDNTGTPINAPREVVSDLLLSGLCKKVGSRSWEFTAPVRALLLRELKRNPVFGPERILELADFTILYANEGLQEKNPLERTIAEVLRWGALAYVRPEEAAERMALALALQLHENNSSGQLRMHHLLEKLAGPMSRFSAFKDLRRFAAGIARNVAGEGQKAKSDFANMQQKVLEIGNVTLEAPEVEQTKPPICFFGYITSPPQQSRNMTVLDFDDEHRQIIPYFRRLEEKGLIRIVVQYDLRPVEIRNILTDPSFENEFVFIHLSGHASTLGEQAPQQQQQVQSKAPFGPAQGFNQNGNLINWQDLATLFNHHQELQLITLDDVLTASQLEDLRYDVSNRLNKTFRPLMPQGLRNLLVIDHTITTASLMPFVLTFYDKFTRNEAINNAVNEASDEKLGQLNMLRTRPVQTWLTNGWWKLSDHSVLTPELFDWETPQALSSEDAAIMACIGEIYTAQNERMGYGLLVEEGQFITSYYYLKGEKGETIRFFRNGLWQSYEYDTDSLVRNESMNIARVAGFTSVNKGPDLNTDQHLPSEDSGQMAGFSWNMEVVYPLFSEDGIPIELERIPILAAIDRFDLRYEIKDWDFLAGIPLMLSNGRVGGFHFGEMSDNFAEKVGVAWPWVNDELGGASPPDEADRIEELEQQLAQEPENLEVLNELTRAYRLSPDHTSKQAREMAERALKIDGQNTFSLNELGMVLKEEGQLEDALNYFNTVLELDDKNRFALRLSAETLISLKDDEQAEIILKKLLEIVPEDAFAYNELAGIEERKGNYQQARELLGQAIIHQPDNPRYKRKLDEINAEIDARSEIFENIREHLQRGDLDLAFKVFETLGTIPADIRERVRAAASRQKELRTQSNASLISPLEYSVQLNQIASEMMEVLDELSGPTSSESAFATIKNVLDQLNDGSLEEALELFKKVPNVSEAMLEEMILMEERLQSLEAQRKQESIDREEYQIGINRLADRLREFTVMLQDNPSSGLDFSDEEAVRNTFRNLISEAADKAAINLLFEWATEREDVLPLAEELEKNYQAFRRGFTLNTITSEAYFAGLTRIRKRILDFLDLENPRNAMSLADVPELAERTEQLEKEFKELLEKEVEDPGDKRVLELLEQLREAYYKLQNVDISNPQWIRQYGLTLEQIGSYYVGIEEWTEAETAFREEVAYFTQKNQLGEYDDSNWLLMATAIANERLADTLRAQNDPGDFAQYQTALRLLKQLEEFAPTYKGLNQALGILHRKLFEIARESEEISGAEEYRRSSREYFAKARPTIQQDEVFRELTEGALEEAIDTFQIYLLQREVQAETIVQVEYLEQRWDNLLLRESSSSGTGNSTLDQEILQFNDREIRYRLFGFMEDAEQLANIDLNELRIDLYREVISFAEKTLEQTAFDPCLQILKDFQQYLTPDRQDRLDQLWSLRQSLGPQYRMWSTEETRQIETGLRELIQEERNLAASANAESSGQADRQEVLFELIDMVRQENLAGVLNNMPRLLPFLKDDESDMETWRSLQEQTFELESGELERTFEESFQETDHYSQLRNNLIQNLRSFLIEKRDEWYPIS